MLPIHGVTKRTAQRWLEELRRREPEDHRPHYLRGYLYELPDGTWCLALRVVDPNRGMPAFDVFLRGARGTMCLASELDDYEWSRKAAAEGRR